MTALRVRQESWPIRGLWTISRGSVTAVEVVVVELEADGYVGRGECRPYPRYGESVEGVIAAIESQREALAAGLDRTALQAALPAGAARNALDCAFWDLEAKRAGQRVWTLLDRPEPAPAITAYSLTLDTPEAMGKAAAEQAGRPLLKLKLGGGPEDLDRVAAVRQNAPAARLVVDANEAWSLADYNALAPKLAALGVEMIEQPLPADRDEALAGVERPVALCADESCHDRASLPGLAARYDQVNIKLDKTGGLSEALALKAAAEAEGLGIMIGCMLASSLALAPAMLLTDGAQVVDLDAPLLLARDREPGLMIEDSKIQPPAVELWG